MKIGLKCEICGYKEKKNLKDHLESEHRLSTKKYKLQFPNSRTMTGHSKRTVEYWYYRGHSYDDSLKLVQEFQGSSKSKFIKRLVENGHTLDSAQNEWNKKQAKNSPRSLEFYIEKGYTVEKAKEERSKYQAKSSKLSSKFKGYRHTQKSRSAISKTIKNHIRKDPKSWVKHFSKNKEGKTLASKEETRCYLELKEVFGELVANVRVKSYIVDMRVGNVVIEYYGDFWHRNPKEYRLEHKAYGKTSKEVWKRDKLRIEEIEKEGYEVFIIWSSDWEYNRKIVINELIKKVHENTNTEGKC